MDFIQIAIIGIGLAMDACAVSIGKGLSLRRVHLRHILSVALWFGGFQALMPIIGYFLGRSFTEYVESIDHWIAFGLLLLIGINMIREALGDEEVKHDSDFGTRTMLLMAIATSIDALAVGVSIAFMRVDIWIAAAIIGIITMVISAAGILLGAKIGAKIGSKAGIIGGVILIAIGTNIVIEHLVV
ncbi:MAG: manganese efflux pump [Alistipes sp.]|nr:manganese efflux pump [Alistipes sp.]